MMDAFKVIKNGKVLDYRIGQKLNAEEIRAEFSKKYNVIDLTQGHRHVIGTLGHGNEKYILKLSTTEGISARTESEKLWNDEFNRTSTRPEFRVPKTIEDGEFKGLYYIITESFDGKPISNLEGHNNLIEENLESIIDFAEYIQTLDLNLPINDAIQDENHVSWFQKKTKSWYEGFPEDKTADLESIWVIVENGAEKLERKPRHGDFTPWHLIKVDQGLALIDGEHSHAHGVENYDIAYFIQRVHSVLEMHDLARKVLMKLIDRGYDKEKLKTVLASRAIGGFLDESFKPDPDYKNELAFAKLVQEL